MQSSYTRLFRNNQHCLNDAIVRSSASGNLVTVWTLNVYWGSEASIVFIQKSKQNKQEFKTGLFDVILDNVVAASAPQILISTIHRQHF